MLLFGNKNHFTKPIVVNVLPKFYNNKTRCLKIEVGIVLWVFMWRSFPFHTTDTSCDSISSYSANTQKWDVHFPLPLSSILSSWRLWHGQGLRIKGVAMWLGDGLHISNLASKYIYCSSCKPSFHEMWNNVSCCVGGAVKKRFEKKVALKYSF